MPLPDTIRPASILVVEDEPDAADLEREYLEEVGYQVETANSTEQAATLLDRTFVDLLLVDERLGHDSGTRFLAQCRQAIPGLGGVLITGYADLQTALSAMRAGVLDLLQKPIRKEQLLETVRRVLADSGVTREARFHRWEAAKRERFPEIIGSSPALKEVLRTVRSVMGTTAPVLIQGESGTGKELIARAIHHGGARHSKPFIAVNAGAIPETLLESTLFGSKRGAFTDSKTDQLGLFQAAQGGTLFLDEIGETSAAVQVSLLRALQEKVILRVGDVKAISIDVRIIAATNKDLKVQVQEGKFRQDLYYRLAVVSVRLPPLRDRTEDIAPLARHLLEKHTQALGKSIRNIRPEAFEKLLRYAWPGNIQGA
jgi:two-component system, NtrC family, response regulator PilR